MPQQSKAPDPQSLPEPDAESRAHSARVAERIRAAIDGAGGAITFARYMELALYEPGLGYYSAGAHKLGAGGDYVTAPEISPLFARCLARQCAEILEAAGGEILELGAGTGALAAELIDELERLGCAPARYRILEVSADLRERQRERLAGRAVEVEWLDTLPEGHTGVILANEVVDAMPVTRFRVDAQGVVERGVGLDGEGGFEWRDLTPSHALSGEITAIQDELGGTLPEGYTAEANLGLRAWAAGLAAALERGVALLIDYGYPRREYYHPQRSGGTLSCYFRHRRHDDPFRWPGIQDITAHVDFTALAEAGHDRGLDVLGYTTQAQFLLANGLTEYAAGAEDAGTAARLALAQQVKTLTLPDDMGELVKVIALGRDVAGPLRGFGLRDLRGRL